MPVKKSTIFFIIVSIAVIAAVLGVFYYQNEKAVVLSEHSEKLQAISELKASQIETWHTERIADAKVLTRDQGFVRLVKSWVENPQNPQLLRQISDRLELPLREYGYLAIKIASPEGKILYSTRDQAMVLSPASLEALRLSVMNSTVEASDFYDDSGQQYIGYDVTAPLSLNGQKPFAVLLLRINTDVLIHPVLNWWPEASPTSETILGTVTGDSVFLVSRLRKQNEDPGGLYISRSDTAVLMVQASFGRRGSVYGIDYQGTPVYGYIASPGKNNWFLITKTDTDEILAGMHLRVFLLSLISALMLMFLTALGLYIYSRRQRNIYRDLWQAEQEFRTTLYSIGDAVITTDIRGRVKHMNPVAEILTGWKEKEAYGKPSEEVFKIINEETRQPVESPVHRVLREGFTVGLANHTLLISKNGKEYPIADSGAPIKNTKSSLTGVVLVFRDQTAERAARIALETSEQRYSRTLSLVDDAVWEWDIPTGNVYASDNLFKMLGYYDRPNLKFDDWIALVQPDDRNQLLENLNNAINRSRSFIMDVRVRNNSGEYIWLEIRSAVAETTSAGRVTRLAGTVINVHERKEAEYKVLLLNQRLERAELSAGLGSWEFNLESGTGYWSPMMFRLFDLAPAVNPPSNEEYYSLIHPEDRHMVENAMSALMSGGTPVIQAYRTNPEKCRLRYLMPTWRFVAGSEGKIIRFEGTLQDITNLRLAQKNYEKLFSEMTEGFSLHKIIRDEHGTPVNFTTESINPAFEKMTGVKPADIIGKPITEVMPGIAPLRVKQLCDVAVTGNPASIEDFNIQQQRYFLLSAFKPFDEHFAIIINDITEEKTADTIKKIQLLIANDALISKSTREMVERLREDLSQYINTDNFLFAEYNEEQSRFTAVYYKDEFDTYTTWRGEGSLSGHVLRQDKICIFGQKEIMKLGGIGLIKLSGRLAMQWVGVPLKAGKNKLGILILQSYHSEELYSPQQRILLEVIGRELSIYLERKEYEQKILESEMHFRQMFENHTAIKFFIHSETGSILDANKAAISFYGYTIDELKKMKITHLNAATGPVIKDRMKLVREGKMNRFEASHRLRSGEIRDVEVFSTPIKQGERVFLYSIIHDITERKKAEEQNKLLIESIEHSPVSVVITDPAGSIAYVNNKFTQVTGYTKGEALGNNPRILKSGRQTKEVYQEMWDKILSGQSWRGELQNKRKNGELYWEDAIITPLMNEEGRVTHFVAVKEDITEKKRMLEELIKAKEEAEEMNKIKSNFFANMSHELRTPLIGILGFSEILQAELEDNPELVYMAETINKGGNRLLETLNLILGLSKLEAGKLEYHNKKTDIVPVIGETCALFRPAALAKGLEMHFKADPDIIYCSLDKILLGNVLNNLINNAVKFTEKGEINVKAETKNGSAVISIADTGIGIADEQKGIVWEEFRQGSEGLSRSYEGTGLGLTIAKKYTEIMGGSITMQSEKGKGTTFTIMFGLMNNE